MHIQGQEGNNTTLTTCTKMTEEVDRRHGMNGNSSSKGVSEEHSPSLPHPPTQTKGGRLKFYKDGKMILELTRGREGEKEGWVAVPHKTIWVPAPSGAPTPTPPSTRQERAASLSVSDDNSSVQSSPWQRDHCWKQATPRRGVGTEMSLMYVRPTCLPARLLRCPAARIKRRRPLCPAPVLPPPANGCSSPSPDHNVYRNTEKPTALGKFKFLRNKDNVAEPVVLRVYKKTKRNYKSRELCKVVDMLKKRLDHFIPVNAKLSNCKQEHSMVSPRKRILRELEKVSLEDPANKRSRAKHPANSNPQPGPSYAPDPSPKLFNGSSNSRSNPPPSKPVSSYSIHSILSITEDSPHRSPEHSAMKKPLSYSGSSKTESPVSIHSPDSHSTRASHYSKASSPLSPDVRRSHYAYSKTESPSPSPSPEQYRRLPAPLPAPRLPYHSHHPLMYPDVGEYYYSEDYLYPVYRQGSPYPAPPYLGPYLGYRPPPVLMQYRAIHPGPWASLPHSLLTDPTPREDASSDLPLNLSKH